MAQLIALRDKVGAADTRVRVSAMHTVWTVALSTGDVQAKTTAIDLLGEPVGSASDHIRMPAIYAIAEIANSTDSLPVKIRARPDPCGAERQQRRAHPGDQRARSRR